MKEWDPHHPKAKLMAQKRAAILAAAQEAFLRNGYEGTTMEAIAASSGISIMTLYRHAPSKDDLFATVVAVACSDQERAELEGLGSQPLADNLDAAARVIQQKSAEPQTVALLRAVIGEVDRFPHLADLTYRSLIGHFEAMVLQLLNTHPEARGRGGPKGELARLFVHQVVGSDLFRALLGLPGSATDADQRARAARDTVLRLL